MARRQEGEGVRPSLPPHASLPIEPGTAAQEAPRAAPQIVHSVGCGGIVIETNVTHEPSPQIEWRYKLRPPTRRASSLPRR